MSRLFIAVPLSQEVVTVLVRLQEVLSRRASSDLKLSPADSMHITLKFLGEISETTASALPVLLDEVCVLYDPIPMRLTACGVFPARGPARVVWCGLAELDGRCRLGSLFSAIETRLERFGIPPDERPFAPHITIGRVKKDAGDVRDCAAGLKVAAIESKASTVALFKSELHPQGSRYTILHEAPLKSEVT